MAAKECGSWAPRSWWQVVMATKTQSTYDNATWGSDRDGGRGFGQEVAWVCLVCYWRAGRPGVVKGRTQEDACAVQIDASMPQIWWIGQRESVHLIVQMERALTSVRLEPFRWARTIMMISVDIHKSTHVSISLRLRHRRPFAEWIITWSP
jgi:hypothetical protein